MKKTITLCIIASICLEFFWPASILLYTAAALTYKNEKKKIDTLETQVNLLARQLGIEYGTPEEKLIQIASIAAEKQEQGRE